MSDNTSRDSIDPNFSGTDVEAKLDWKSELLAILAGERATVIIRAGGSASDYVSSMIPTSPRSNIARCALGDALSDLLREISLGSLSSSGLNHLLDLIADLRPSNAFQALASYLKLGDTTECDFVPLGGSVAFDLHEKILETLEIDFDIPPLNAEDPAFLTYIEILRQQMLNPRYRAYAAFQLIKLEVLQTDSDEFKELVKHDLVGTGEILHNLVMFGSSGYGFGDIKAVFFECLGYGTEGLNILSAALNRSGSTLELPWFEEITEESLTPSIRLFNGVEIPINLNEDQLFLVYRHRYEMDMQADLQSLLSAGLEDNERDETLTKLFNKACEFGSLDSKFLAFFEDQIEARGGELIMDHDRNDVYVGIGQDVIRVQLDRIQSKSRQTFLTYVNQSRNVPTNPPEIERAIVETIAREEKVFRKTA